MSNPYIKNPKSSKEPLILRVPIHDFDSGSHMEQELIPYEQCYARIPNLTQEGFTHHVALVYKDGNGNIFSIAAMQHQGTLKETKENYDAFQKQSTESLLDSKQAGSSEEVRDGQRGGGESTRPSAPDKSKTTKTTHNTTPTTEQLKWHPHSVHT